MQDFVKGKQVPLSNGSWVKVAKYSPDGGHLALLSENSLISIVDCVSCNTVFEIDCTTEYGEVRDIEFSKNSKILGAAAHDHMVLYGNPRGKLYKAYKPPKLERKNYFTRLFFGHPHVLIGLAKSFRHIYIYSDYTSDSPLNYNRYLPHGSVITSLSFISHPEVITSYLDGLCMKWDSSTFHKIIPELVRDYNESTGSYKQELFPNYNLDFPIPFNKITHTDVSHDNRYVLITHACSKISSYERQQKKLRSLTFLRTYVGHEGRMEGLHEMKGKFMFHNKRNFVICGSETFHIYIWDFETAEIVTNLDCNGALPISIILPLEVFNKFAVLEGNGEVYMWEKKSKV